MITLEPYQEEAAQKSLPILQRNRIVGLKFWMRKGKTLTSMVVSDRYLANVERPLVLFVTDKSAIPSISKDYDDLKPRYEIILINFQSLHKITNDQVKRTNIVIVDECHKISSFPKPGVWAQQLKKICDHKPIIYLSATWTPESFSQYYHIFWISTYSPLAKWPNFYRFADEFVNKVQQEYKGLPSTNYSNCDAKKLKPYVDHLFVVVGEDDGKQLVKVKHNIHYVDMSPKAIEIFNQLKRNKIYIDDAGNAATCNSGAERDFKLLQIGSGTLIFNETIDGSISEDGKIIDTTKAQFIKSYYYGKKIAILFAFKAEGRMLKSFFPNWTDDEYKFNESTDNSIVFIRQIKSTKTGVNLSTADHIVVFTPLDSAETFIQGSARSQHKDRTTVPNVDWIMSRHGKEAKIFKNNNDKKHEFTDSHYV